MSLWGIARTLGIDYKTVLRYFRENAKKAKEANNQQIKEKGLVTSYAQFDQLETFEHTKRKPVGIQLSIRHKTGEIISPRWGIFQSGPCLFQSFTPQIGISSSIIIT